MGTEEKQQPWSDCDPSATSARERMVQVLEDASLLLKYAVEAGQDIDPAVAAVVIDATRRGREIFDGPDGGKFLAAVGKLAASVHPVTAEALRSCREASEKVIRRYEWGTIVLAFLILPISVLSFIQTGISNSITSNLNVTNGLVVTLHTQLEPAPQADQTPPPGTLEELQQLGVTMRTIYSRSRQLSVFSLFVPSLVADPLQCKKKTPADAETGQEKDCGFGSMELPDNLSATSWIQQSGEVTRLTPVYQKVRLFATNVQDATSVLWGAVSSCILPVLYALLGACASVLRASAQIEARTMTLSHTTLARLVIAGIAGMVVGLFNNPSITQTGSLPPLALAFLVGYAADIFFAFLEGATQSIYKSKQRP